MRYLVGLLAVGWLAATFPAGAQTPWPRAKSELYAQVAWQAIPAYTSLFSETSGVDRAIERELNENAIQLFADYGFTERFSAGAALPVRFMRSGAPVPGVQGPGTVAGRLTGIGNPLLWCRYRLLNGTLPLTVTLRAELPVAPVNNQSGLRTGYDAFSLLPMLSTGMGFKRLYWFSYAGYGYRTNGYSAFALTGVEAGLRLSRIYLIGFIESLHSVENGNKPASTFQAATGLYVDRQGYLSPGVKLLYRLPRGLGVFASLATAIRAQNLPKSPGLSAGIFYQPP
jgi:hypothetical protein